MSATHYDLFFTEPGTVEEMFCMVCGTHCNVERNQYGPTSYMGYLAKRDRLHDKFSCPHSNTSWHEQALELVKQIEENPSKRVPELMRKDLEELLQEHGCHLNQKNGLNESER